MGGVWAVLAISLALGGCATVARGTSEQLAFDTAPSGAEVRVVTTGPVMHDQQGMAMPSSDMGCVTPCVLQVKRADKLAVRITKPGFETESFALNPEASGSGVGGAMGNILIGGVVGVVVDSASGAMLDHCPNPIRINLRALPSTARGRQHSASHGGFGFDPVAACKAQTTAKYETSQPRSDAPSQ